MVGSAIVRQLQKQGQDNIVTRPHAALDLTNQAAVRGFFESEKPDQVYLAAAKVGGIIDSPAARGSGPPAIPVAAWCG